MSLPTQRSYLPLTLCMMALMVIALMACNKGGRYEDDEDEGGGQQPPGFSLSGSIGVAENTAVDGDLNDEGTVSVPNDDFDQAQELPVPVVLGGYVNQPQAGPTGNSYAAGDPSDFYRLELESGQALRLGFGSYPASEIHLNLYDQDHHLVDASKSDGNTQSLTIAAAGTYYLEVFAAAGADNYTLTVNLAELSVVGTSPLRLSDDFVPGEVIVEMVTADAGAITATLSSMGLEPIGSQRPKLIRFEVGDLDDGEAQLLRALGGRREDEHRGRIDPSDRELLAKWDTIEMVRHLRVQPGVRGADLNYRRYALGLTPDDTHFQKQWHYGLINLPNAWEQTRGSSDVVVAVIDTGVLLDHPDLQGKLVAGYDFISDATMANDGDGMDADPDDPGDSLEMNSSFHGTHVAGTIAALSDNAGGVAGAAWQTRVMPLRVLGVNGGTSYDLIQALQYAAGLPNDSGELPQRAADIINLSLGGGSYSEAEQAAITAVRDAGLIIVAAAGNSGGPAPHYPASYYGVVSVSAVDSEAELAPYSSYGASVDVAAPGGNTGTDLDGDGYPDGVLSTCGEEGAGAGDAINMVYCYQQGTSMATPHVAAVAALMKAVDAEMTPADFDARLVAGRLTSDLGAEGWDDSFGHGLIDAYQSVLSAMESAPTVAIFEPAALAFGRTDETLPLSVSRLGDDGLAILAVSGDAGWLQASGQDLDGDGFGTYQVAVDRTDLADGIYLAHLNVETSTGTRSVAVKMQVLAETTSGALANHYVLLLDSDSGDAVGQAQVASTGAFTIEGVRPGGYYLIAGSDMDNDNYIGDAGEAFGAYLSLDNPTLLEIGDNRSGLDMVTSFRLSLSGTASGTPDPLDAAGYPVLKRELRR